jgi:pyruvate/2-oxoglutarate dehydrogenase complex dihydrolipoamide acyltransferase (E2) component
MFYTKNISGEKVFASPLAKKIALEKGIILEEITGSGPGGRILEQDVIAFSSVPTS